MERRPTKAEMLLMIATSLSGMAAALWMEMSPAQRELLAMTVRARCRRAAAVLARATGHHGMGHELAGREGAASLRYTVAYKLSMLRDRL